MKPPKRFENSENLLNLFFIAIGKEFRRPVRPWHSVLYAITLCCQTRICIALTIFVKKALGLACNSFEIGMNNVSDSQCPQYNS